MTTEEYRWEYPDSVWEKGEIRDMKYTITNRSGLPTITISKMMPKHIGEDGKVVPADRIYAERNSCVACSPIYNEADAKAAMEARESGDVKAAEEAEKRVGKLVRRRLMITEIQGKRYAREVKPTALSQGWADFMLGTKQTLDRKRIGERSYVLYEALADNQKATFRSCFPGVIMPWDASPLEEGEVYVKPEKFYEEHSEEEVPSVFHEDTKKRPHGILRAVQGSFLVAELKVSAEVYHTKKVLVVKFSETKDSFQEFSGNGMVFLEVHGNLQEIPLYPGESVDVFPGYLLGFTESVDPEMKPAGDVTLRNEENNDYVIRLRADDRGGFVYTHSVKVKDFFERGEK